MLLKMHSHVLSLNAGKHNFLFLAIFAQHKAARGDEREPQMPNTRSKEEKWSWLIVFSTRLREYLV